MYFTNVCKSKKNMFEQNNTITTKSDHHIISHRYAVHQKLILKNTCDVTWTVSTEGRAARLRNAPFCPAPRSLALSRTRSVHGEGDENEMRTVMEELSAVGEQVFDAECILNKRLRKVRNTHTNTHT